MTELEGGETGDYESLRADAVDPAAPVDATLGRKPFLVWMAEKNVNGYEEWVARGVDGTIYRIKPFILVTPPSENATVEKD